mmetsp:Transcript_80944/g.241220  ORF Transcript_80944/g.241220 Transcript_80944/m.241220 type:complete len:216 (+) Transcript_80944:161-808(+)
MVEKGFGTCLLCIPLRLGIVFVALATLFHGVFGLFALVTGDVRFQSGGYSKHTARLQAATGSLGLIFGLLGLLGIYDKKPNWIRSLARFLEARLVVAGLVFVFDLVALMRCPAWASFPQSKVANFPLYMISSKGLCSTAQLCYGIGFTIDFGVSYYLTWVTHTFCRRLETTQTYHIRFAHGTDSHSQAKLTDPIHGAPNQYLGGVAGSSPAAYGT